jgi:hypothetical protein
MRPTSIYSAFAVMLPVSLGLGLVYLVSIGRIEPGVAIVASLGLAVLIACAIWLRDFAANSPFRGRGE